MTKPKFQIGDQVYLMVNNRVKMMQVASVTIWLQGEALFRYCLTCNLSQFDLLKPNALLGNGKFERTDWTPEDKLFKTKEQLIKSL